jgi:two-component system phosphate regulon sensor histidine kinase PhoR
LRRLSSKIFISHLLVILILTSLIVVFSFRIIQNDYEESLIRNLTTLNHTFQFKLKDFIISNNLTEIDSLTKAVGDEINVRITVVDINGNVIGDSESNPELMDNHKNRPEIKNALTGSIGKSNRYSITVQNNMIYLALPIVINDKVVGVARVSYFSNDFDNLLDSLLKNMIELSLIVILITMIGVLVFARNLTKPINQLSIAASNVAGGDFDFKVNVKSKDEIATLARNFNLMTIKLKDLFGQVISQKEELNSIITSIDEGLVSLNSEGRILLANGTFNDIIETESVEGKKYKKIIKEKSFKNLFKETLNNKKNITKEINVKDNYYLASANYIESKNEVVILFHDITELKKLEQIKRDFAINVSHELRTPLTAIKGFLETMQSEVEGNDTALKYMNIISRHTNRLIDLVQDLLILSEIEDGKIKLIFTEINIYKFIQNVAKIFDQKLKDKNIILEMNTEDKNLKIEADIFKLEQVFINLIDNAIKYTDKGKIIINIKNVKENINISIEDTGIGIPDEDVDRIFERFYLVNKARTRKEGGTGLGLSIVKHIILNHNGKIKVESKIDVGTKFLIKLPIVQNKNEEIV